ncbi:tudor domain-containing protein 3 [Rhagoletis pomonella]|uniref:tudor domain-containing protein 3 n=1 Tax=Rhagoletis pomonella TaxID=28610 RepID=UPI0017814E6E|nr:tudor domain-containing protein 3 [Rhagoletis pomonella]
MSIVSRDWQNFCKMDLNRKLLNQGWHITDDGLKKVTAAFSNAGGPEINDERKIISTIMDMDFRDIAAGALPTKRDDNISGRIVLQLQKTRNVSAPKSNEDSKAAPRFLHLELSDGVTTIQALELENIPALSTNLPPGTKIYFTSDRLELIQGFLILRSSELQVLGGRVEAMVEKWELARTMQKYARSGRRMSGATGPPPWIPFGKKVETSLSKERNFKSLQIGGPEGKDSKENQEFNAMRNEAIAEASKAGSKKVFGGGGQQMLDHNVKKILEKGFSEEDAKQALRATNNNLERALYNLKRRGESKRTEEIGSAKNLQVTTYSAKNGRGPPVRDIGKRGGSMTKEETVVAKPAGNVSLFDFLTDKLPVDAATNVLTTANTASIPHTTSNVSTNPLKSGKFDRNKKEASKSTHTDSKHAEDNVDPNSVLRPRFENNMSSSFAANRSTGLPNARQRTDRAYNRGGRSSHERGRSTSIFNPFKHNGNERVNDTARGSGSQTINNNHNLNQGRINRGNYERGKGLNPLSGGFQENGTSGYASKRANERQQQRSHGGEERSSGGQNESRNRFNSKRENSNRQQNNNIDNKNSAAAKNSGAQNSNSNNANPMHKLIEATSKIRLSDPVRNDPHLTGNSSIADGRSNLHDSQFVAQAQGGAQLANQIQSSTQLPKGYGYDTSKIIGFQNKETNEFALTLLKSQGLGSSESTIYSQQQRNLVSPNIDNPGSQPNLHISNESYISHVPPHIQAPPQLSGYAAPINEYSSLNPSTVGTIAAVQTHFGMIPGEGWDWKVGDLCFAKYWDDGRYYEAEVTAVSEKTCVVFYLGYGNHEEVLKSDCLPITDGNHCPINNYNTANSYQQPQQGKSNTINQIHSAQQIQVGGAYQRGGGGQQRFRGERQMYVPPHKREN